mmetsp:Transcript_19376/g.40774  ORF Transcript_19376/g.40774 Transcript_19376/m.40774 type:complete len:254 (-) Transcript_19376:2502-3263(-)
MDRLVPNDNNLPPYYSGENNFGMQYQYNPAYFGSSSDERLERARERGDAPAALNYGQYGGDGARLPPGMLPFDTGLFSNGAHELLTQEHDSYRKAFGEYMQLGVASSHGGAMAAGAKAKKGKGAKDKPSAKLTSVDKKVGKKAGAKAATKPGGKEAAGPAASKSENGDGAPNEHEAKRMKRLLRNRVSAQLARERKKQYVLGLEKKAKESDKKIKELQDKVKKLTKENETLKAALAEKGSAAFAPESDAAENA